MSTRRTRPDAAATEWAFADLFERAPRRGHGYARRHREEADCDDVVAEVFVAAWRRFDDLPPQSVLWFLATARQSWRTVGGGRDRRQRLEAEARSVARLAAYLDPAGLVTDRDTMLAALSALSADDREPLLLVA